MFSTNFLQTNGSGQFQYGLVAVAYSGVGVNRTTSVITTSHDAVTWTTRSVSFDESIGTFLSAVTWSEELNLWCASGDHRPGFPGTYQKIWTSRGGKTWTPREFPSDSVNHKLGLRAISWIYAKNKFYAGGGGSLNNIGFNMISSSDGITWVGSGGLTNSNFIVSGISYSPGLDRAYTPFANAATNGQRSTDVDLSSWVTSSRPSVSGVAFMNATLWVEELGLFLQVGAGVSAFYSATALGQIGIPTQWVAAATPDGATYTALAWSPTLSLVVAVANTGTERVMYSSDGVTWSNASVTGAGGQNWNGITWFPYLDKFVAVGDGGITMNSSDGINWTQVMSSLTGTGLQARNIKGINWGLII